jgi:hypothetical protein
MIDGYEKSHVRGKKGLSKPDIPQKSQLLFLMLRKTSS